MLKLYCNVKARSVLEKFNSAIPCSCHQYNIFKSPTYNVRIHTADLSIVGRGTLIKRITIECNSCGIEKTTNVEELGVFENDFKPY